MFGILQDTLYETHETGAHPERPQRLQAVRQGLAEGLGTHSFQTITPVAATTADLELVHTPQYVAWVKEQVEAGSPQLDPDTAVCPKSYDVACHAVGGCLAGLDALMEGRFRYGFFAIRPPGHHAEPDRSMGFCLFNNIAIGARHLIKRSELDRVAILDFDVHHGNGTQAAFYDDPSVFYCSIHQWPYYPGTGRADESGKGPGIGTTLNLPFPAGAGDDEYEDATQRFAEAMKQYQPQMLLVSAGYDAHWSDPLAGHQVTENGYIAIIETLVDIARTHTEGRIAFFLEGGYQLATLRNCVAATIRTLANAG
jgi:acetoin utilization deacetylase AcuC-like enzyme